MSTDLGVGAMISMLGGNEDSVKAFQKGVGKRINHNGYYGGISLRAREESPE